MYSVQRVALADLSVASEADLLKMQMPLQMAELTRFRQRSPVFLGGRVPDSLDRPSSVRRLNRRQLRLILPLPVVFQSPEPVAESPHREQSRRFQSL